MSTEKKTGLAADAEAAAQLEAEAQAGPDIRTYTHTFEEPFQFRGHTVTELTFNWGGLTGEDHQAIEDDSLCCCCVSEVLLYTLDAGCYDLLSADMGSTGGGGLLLLAPIGFQIPFRSCLWCFTLAGLLQLAGAVPS